MEMASLPPVTKEQAFLETYFQCLSKFAFDKGKELSEKEKDAVAKANPGSTWGALVTCLLHLAMAEKAYASLVFLGISQNLAGKLFGRKDSLKNTYSSVQLELRRMEENTLRNPASSPVSGPQQQTDEEKCKEELLGHLSGQLWQYIAARLRLIEFYEQMSAMAQYRNMSCEDLKVVIMDIITEHSKNFHHPILSPFKSNFSLECDIIRHLLEAQLKLQDAEFLPSLLHLHDAHTKITSWGDVSQQKEDKKLLFGSSSKHPPVPAVYQWLSRYKGLLVAKFSLYFYELLKQQASSQDVNKMTAKLTVDLHAKVVAFHRRGDAVNTCLMLSTYDPERKEHLPYAGPGYHHPDRVSETPRGISSYPAIYSYPSEKPEKHWPNVISIVTDKQMELNAQEKVSYFYDEKFQSSYFLAKVDPRITMVVIFEVKKSEKDSYVNNFINDLCGYLRCTKLFASLKPGSK